MTTVSVNENKRLTNSPIYLPVGETSGKFTISIPFVAEYIMVLNDTIATIAVCIGEQSTQGPESQLWTPGKYISMPLTQAAQKLTVFWTSTQPISADNNLVQFYFSNITISLQGGNYGAAAESQNVDVLNTVTTQFASTQNVNIQAMPSIPAGANNIGHVNVDQLPSQGLISGPISSSQVPVSSSASALVSSVINGKKIKIKNIDATNSIFVGTSAVTTANGFELFPKDEIDLDIVSGSTISIYGIASAGTPTASILVLN